MDRSDFVHLLTSLHEDRDVATALYMWERIEQLERECRELRTALRETVKYPAKQQKEM